MHKAIKLMAVSLNLSILILFAFFTMSLMAEGKAGSMAEAVTTGTDVELIEDLTPQLIGNNEQAMCMALNIYYESRSDNLAGQYAVADVVLNRVHDDRYPDTVCEVITQGPVKESWKTKQDPDLLEEDREYNPIRHLCQFSWYCDGKSDKPRESKAWEDAKHVANGVYNEHLADFVEGATHYHADYVNPSWAETKTHVMRIDDHIFYRWETKPNN